MLKKGDFFLFSTNNNVLNDLSNNQRSFTLKHKFKNLKKFTLVATLCATTALGAHSIAHAEGFSDAQKKEMESVIKEYLMSNPEVIIEAVENFRVKQEQQMEKSAKESLSKYKDMFKQDNLPIGGNPEGDVTVVEFFDYNCGYCRKAFDDLRKLIEQDSNLRVVFQEMPILSPSSKKMAQIALAAHNQGKYFEMHAALMDYKGTQNDSAYFKLAEKIGLDVEKLKTDMESQAVQAAIGKSMDMARDLGIRGTPGFIVGNEIYPGYIGMQGMKEAIAKARKEASE